MALRLTRVLPSFSTPSFRLCHTQRPFLQLLSVFQTQTNQLQQPQTKKQSFPLRLFPVVRYVRTGLTPDTVKQKVLEVCSGFEKIPMDKLTMDSHFMKDLGLDSLDHIEVIMEIENEFWLEIPDVDAEKLFTPRDIVNHVCAKMEKAAPIE